MQFEDYSSVEHQPSGPARRTLFRSVSGVRHHLSGPGLSWRPYSPEHVFTFPHREIAALYIGRADVLRVRVAFNDLLPCADAFGIHAGFRSGRLTSSNEGTWVLFHHDSSAAPQTVQTASPVCDTKNFVSVRLYSAPQLHRTIVAIPGICARNRRFSSVEVGDNQTDHDSHLASLAGQAMNRYRGTQAEFQFSIVSPHTAHSKLLISRASAMCSLRS